MNLWIFPVITLVVSVLALWLMWPWAGVMLWLAVIMPHRDEEQLKQMLAAHRRGVAVPTILTEMHRRHLDLEFAIPLLARMMVSRSFLQRAFGSNCMRRFTPHILTAVNYRPWQISRDARRHLQSLIDADERPGSREHS